MTSPQNRSAAAHHGHHRAISGEPLSQPWVRVDAGRRVEFVGEDVTAGDITISEISPVKALPCFGVYDMWGPLTHGAQLLVPMGVMCSGASSILGLFTDLVYLFLDCESNLAKIISPHLT